MTKNIIMISLFRHDDKNSCTSIEIAKKLSIKNKVLLIEHPYTLFDCAKKILKPSIWKRIISTLKTRVIKSDVFNDLEIIVPPICIPINWLSKGKIYSFLQGLNHKIIARVINKYLRQNGWENYIYINSYNYHFPKLSERLENHCCLNVYHCVDPIIKNYTRKHGLVNEEVAASQSDVVISTSYSLKEKWSKYNHSYLVTNGVSKNVINKFSFDNQLIDFRIRSLGPAVIGYFGAVERRLDYRLLSQIFRHRMDWQLVLCGNYEKKFIDKELVNLPNVHLWGSYHHSELTSLINAVDAVVVPFKKDEVSANIFPIKLYEYLASGKPIVSTDFNDFITAKLSHLISFSSSVEAFAIDLNEALRNPFSGIERRKLAAKNNTWEKKAEQFQHILNLEYERKISTIPSEK